MSNDLFPVDARYGIIDTAAPMLLRNANSRPLEWTPSVSNAEHMSLEAASRIVEDVFCATGQTLHIVDFQQLAIHASLWREAFDVYVYSGHSETNAAEMASRVVSHIQFIVQGRP